MPPTPLTVTRPSLPSLEKYTEALREIWQSRCVTNIGNFHQHFEHALSCYLQVKHISLFCNGTLAMQTGLKALGISGEVITTPFTFPATAHSIYWNRCTPVFCDIEPDSFGLDPEQIEPLITPHTTAIMPVHVYGRPCNIDKIRQIADLYGLKVVYDAAHAFGVQRPDGSSLASCGDLSMVSFHATKVFNTVEGGALITSDSAFKKRVDYLKNFGIADEETVIGEGINGKMNELIAALGLLQLENIDKEIDSRRRLARRYRRNLMQIPGLEIPEEPQCRRYNYCYFPVLINRDEFGMDRDTLYRKLRNHDIWPRKYFSPLLTAAPCYRHLPSAQPGKIPVAEEVAAKVLCLPLYAELTEEQVDFISEVTADPKHQ